MVRLPPHRKPSRSKPAGAAVPPPPHPAVFYRLHSLLHTMRAIQAHEDQLCTLHNELRTSNTVSREITAELRQLLEDLPSAEYQEDVDALRRTLGVTTFVRQKARPPVRKNQAPSATKQTSRSKSQEIKNRQSNKTNSSQGGARKQVTARTRSKPTSQAPTKTVSRRSSTSRKRA